MLHNASAALDASCSFREAWFYHSLPFRLVAAYEPHSVLPFGGCVFTEHAEGMPRCLTNTYVASTSTVGVVWSAVVYRSELPLLGCHDQSGITAWLHQIPHLLMQCTVRLPWPKRLRITRACPGVHLPLDAPPGVLAGLPPRLPRGTGFGHCWFVGWCWLPQVILFLDEMTCRLPCNSL